MWIAIGSRYDLSSTVQRPIIEIAQHQSVWNWIEWSSCRFIHDWRGAFLSIVSENWGWAIVDCCQFMFRRVVSFGLSKSVPLCQVSTVLVMEPLACWNSCVGPLLWPCNYLATLSNWISSKLCELASYPSMNCNIDPEMTLIISKIWDYICLDWIKYCCTARKSSDIPFIDNW